MGFAEGLRKNVHDMIYETLVVDAKRLDSSSLNVITFHYTTWRQSDLISVII